MDGNTDSAETVPRFCPKCVQVLQVAIEKSETYQFCPACGSQLLEVPQGSMYPPREERFRHVYGCYFSLLGGGIALIGLAVVSFIAGAKENNPFGVALGLLVCLGWYAFPIGAAVGAVVGMFLDIYWWRRG
jgi:hypothetical protein